MAGHTQGNEPEVIGHRSHPVDRKSGRGEFPLLTLADIRALPEPDWLIPGIIVAGSLVMLVGEANIGKTFLALDWSFRIGSGTDWAGEPVTKGPVVYIASEGVRYLEKRAVAWEEHFGINESSFEDMARFVPRAVSMLDAGSVEELIAALASLPRPPVLVVIDTLARCMG